MAMAAALPLLLLPSLLWLGTAAQNAVATRDLWCVAKNNAADDALQSAIDWACGPGGSNCGPIQSGGPCYDATDIQRTASWAFNDYYLKHGLTDDACYFSNTAALTSLNPSHGSCKFPSSLSVSNGSTSSATTSSTIGLGPDSADLSSASISCGVWSMQFLIILFTLMSAWCCSQLTSGQGLAFL